MGPKYVQQCAKSSSSDGRVHQISRRRRKEGCRRTWIIGGIDKKIAMGCCKFSKFTKRLIICSLIYFSAANKEEHYVLRPSLVVIANSIHTRRFNMTIENYSSSINRH